MTAKIDGTNGVLQQYDYQTPATGFSYTFAAGTQMLFMVPSGTLASGTITMPSAPADGMVITFSSSQQITALTLQGNTGQSVSSAVTFLPAKTAASYVYRLANTTWYPCQTVPGTGSQLVSGVAVNSTSGTSIDFTGIPAWAKRVTIMFKGVSTNGTSTPLVQIGSGSVSTTGYSSTGWIGYNTNASAVTSSTAGFVFYNTLAAALLSGTVVLTLVSANTWVCNACIGNQTSFVYAFSTTGVSPALSGALDRVRITTANGTDAFDAGVINILYE